MQISLLKASENFSNNNNLQKAVGKFNELLIEINSRNLEETTCSIIQKEVDTLNGLAITDKKFRSNLRSAQSLIVKYIEKNHKLVPQKHYTKLWMVLGMSLFGLPLGSAIGLASKNMGLLGIGLPIGMAIGVGIGAGMDKKAANEGRQLGVEI